jgi:hypothetical protein
MARAPEEHDVVELRAEVDGWRAGTRGAVVSTYDTGKVLIEIADQRGRTLDLVGVAREKVEIVRVGK